MQHGHGHTAWIWTLTIPNNNNHLCEHFHFILKFPPNKNTTQSKFQGHAFESCFWQSCDYEWWIAKNLDSRSSWVFRPKKIGEFHLRSPFRLQNRRSWLLGGALWRACNLSAVSPCLTGPVDYPFASCHKGSGFKSFGGYLSEAGILLLPLSRFKREIYKNSLSWKNNKNNCN